MPYGIPLFVEYQKDLLLNHFLTIADDETLLVVVYALAVHVVRTNELALCVKLKCLDAGRNLNITLKNQNGVF